MANFARLKVNEVECVANMDGRRSMESCVTCGRMTQGRMTVLREGVRKEQKVVCLKDSMALLIETAFAPVGETIRAIHAAFGADTDVRGVRRTDG